MTDIMPGMRVSLFIPQNKGEDMHGALELTSIVEDADDNYLSIQTPTHRGYFYPLPEDALCVRFFVETEPYSLKVQYEERVVLDGFNISMMRRLTDCARHQMRDNFRMSCHMPVAVEHGLGRSGGLALDLSENGMLLLTNEEIKDGDTLTVSFDTGTSETVECVVIRMDKQDGDKYRYRAGLRFNHRQRDQANRIYKYVVRMQRERLR